MQGTYLLEALNTLLHDDAFVKLDTKRINAAVKLAKKLKEWIPLNVVNVLFFEAELLKHFKRCSGEGMGNKEEREQCLVRYHKLRSSTVFKNLWKVFLSPLGDNSIHIDDPIFFQYITRKVFNSYITQTFPIASNSSTAEILFALTFEESNALRYVAGYVCFNLYQKVIRSSNQKKEDLLLGIKDMIDDDDDHDNTDSSSSWVNAVDRGGLVHVHDTVHKFFINVERVVRRYFTIKKSSELQAGIKKNIMESILSDNGVHTSWSAIGIELQPEDGDTLLRMIADLFVTIRGFSFAGAYIELYKQSTKKSLQRSKALRTKLETGGEK